MATTTKLALWAAGGAFVGSLVATTILLLTFYIVL